MQTEPIDSPAAPPTASGFAAARVLVKPRKAAMFYSRHPWVLDSAIERIEGAPADGDIVDLVRSRGKFIARGIYNSRSRIRVRLFSWQPTEALDSAFWRGRLTSAVELRRTLGYDRPDGACRLVYSEGDGVSGLIVDRYGDYLSVQATALGIEARLDEILPLLIDVARPRSIVIRTEKGVPQAEGVSLRDGPVWGEPPPAYIFIEEHALRYGVDLAEGQKTGFYLDQRENRRAAAGYFADRRVLDVFSYSGAFSLCAARHGPAREVLGIDGSAKAVAMARENAQLNGVTTAHFEIGDAFATLATMVERGERFGGVILDPPKFARTRRAVDDALRAYHRLNRLAVELLEPSGILVTCSCSGLVTREHFLAMLGGVAQKTRRNIQILEQRGAAPDHPVNPNCPENDYLKCFICRVV